jgi:very-short-patch-repair endonuclease
VIEALATRQHGVVSRAQLVAAGVSPDLLDHRLRAGRLHPVHRGVYRVGPLMGALSREMSAVLACGDAAVVSHRSAAVVWELLPRGRDSEPVDVAVAKDRAGSRRGIRVHQLRTLRSDEMTTRNAIPITTVTRTLYDLSTCTSERELERALAESSALGLVQRAELDALIERHGRRRGSTRLRRMIQGETRVSITRSEAEERFLELVRKARLPHPGVNTTAAGYEVDFLWRSERLVVEVDGRAFHSTDRRFETDRRRDADLIAAGLRVMRVTWRQLVNEPEALLVRLAQALARSAP